jgi:hypothetical protein
MMEAMSASSSVNPRGCRMETCQPVGFGLGVGVGTGVDCVG